MGTATETMETKETQVHRAFSEEVLRAHFLEPGDVCTNPHDPDGTYGVVINTPLNTEKVVLVKFGTEPIRNFPRAILQWVGPIDQ